MKRDSEKYESVAAEAERVVYGGRNDNYGHPADNLTRIGRIWGAILGLPDIEPRLVALCLVGVKQSREVNRPTRDNLVDICGYAVCADRAKRRADGLE